MATTAEAHRHATERNPHLGMAFFILSEAFLFAAFFAAYFYLRGISPSWPQPPSIHRPELPLVLYNTAILLFSSLTYHWATLGIRQGNRNRLTAGVLVTLLLGATFMAIQGWEFAHNGFSPQDGLFGSTFYSLVSLHGLHVFMGLVLLAMVFIRSLRGLFSQEGHSAVEVTGYYWHFVDVVWLFLFTTVYVI